MRFRVCPACPPLAGFRPRIFRKNLSSKQKIFHSFSFLRAGGILKKLKDCLPAENFADFELCS
jgi:hypothetical protein